uniref:Uncharacterized protein n=1 Tax=Medicago truncatula TaxID=3880 RepID=I3S762_MEDTR|nr:unknown [Medicago truncatula]
MDPRIFLSTMKRAACLIAASDPRTLMAMVLSNSFRSNSSMLLDIPPSIPALLNIMSRVPYFSNAKATVSSTCFSSLTSQWW